MSLARRTTYKTSSKFLSLARCARFAFPTEGNIIQACRLAKKVRRSVFGNNLMCAELQPPVLQCSSSLTCHCHEHRSFRCQATKDPVLASNRRVPFATPPAFTMFDPILSFTCSII
jgi:hypothetical protein